MKPQFFAAIHQICDEKNIPYERVIETIKAALATAYRKDFGNKEQEVEIILSEDSDIATVLLVKEVVEDVENPNIEISLAEAQKMKKDVETGDIIKIDVTPLEYGRIAAQSAKQVILQRLQEAERDSTYEMFKNRENEIMSAQVMRIEGGNVHIQIEKHNVSLGPKDQIPDEKYYNGKRMKVYLDKVIHTNKGPQLSISRTHPNLVVRLLEMEIPEIAEGEVQVKSIARDPGTRSKVAVFAEDEKIDPVGACIGQKGVRIQSVMNELNGERVDIIEWTKDPKEFIATSLQPAKIAEVIIVNSGEDEKVRKRAAVFVEEEERPMAIGKRGQNVRLASDLTGYELDLYNLEQLPAFKEKVQEMMKTTRRIDDKDLESPSAEKELEAAEKSLKSEEGADWGSLTAAVTKKLEAAGYNSLEDLKGMSLKDLEGIEGIGKVSAKKIESEL
ncbi:transcription termination/antitermination protein NusA [Candidatus Peregrinibacteria bacterium]|nr:transcription termination/antitermination protein NusA [Candidatus Peregrinibacteria bacterium]